MHLILPLTLKVKFFRRFPFFGRFYLIGNLVATFISQSNLQNEYSYWFSRDVNRNKYAFHFSKKIYIKPRNNQVKTLQPHQIAIMFMNSFVAFAILVASQFSLACAKANLPPIPADKSTPIHQRLSLTAPQSE